MVRRIDRQTGIQTSNSTDGQREKDNPKNRQKDDYVTEYIS